ncbi:hypothetical protein V2O64_20330 [Verrucomicrobiaceae bacterium 227]
MNPETNQAKVSPAEKVAHLTDDVKRSTNELVDEAGNRIGSALENVNEKAVDLKHRAEQRYGDTVSPKIDTAQMQIAGASRYLQENSLPDFLRDLESFSKEHPRITAAVSLFLGWKLGRALTFGK